MPEVGNEWQVDGCDCRMNACEILMMAAVLYLDKGRYTNTQKLQNFIKLNTIQIEVE